MIYLGKFDHDLTVLPHWKSWLICGKSSPFMAELFRLVNYYNLPRKLEFGNGFHDDFKDLFIGF